jgi:hypothetical protein
MVTCIMLKDIIAECRVLDIVKLSATMLSVLMLSFKVLIEWIEIL